MLKKRASINYRKFVKYLVLSNILYLSARLYNPSNIKPMILLLVLFSFYILYKWKGFTGAFPCFNRKLFTCYILYNYIVFLGGFIIDSPDYIVIMSSGITISSVMLFVVIGTRLDMFGAYLRYYMLFALPFSVILYSITMAGTNDFPHFVSIFQLLLLATPFIDNKKVRLFIYGLNILSLFYNLDCRSNVLSILGSLIILIAYYFIVRKKALKRFRYIYMLLPLIPLVLVLAAFYWNFNFFEFLAERDSGDNTLVDSRTGIYLDVWNGLAEKDAYLFGLGSSGKYKTHLSDLLNGDFYISGRSFCETNILNVLSMSGLTGCLLYIGFLISCITYAFKHSRNDFMLLAALYACLKFGMIFIEEIQDFSLNYVNFALTFGLCINVELLKMTNDDVRQYFKKCLLFIFKNKDMGKKHFE